MITIDSELDRLFGNIFGEETKIKAHAEGRMSSLAPSVQNIPKDSTMVKVMSTPGPIKKEYSYGR